MSMLSGPVAETVRARLAELPRPVVLHTFTREDRLVIPGRDPSPGVRETVQLLEELAALTERVRVQVHDLDREPELAARLEIRRAPAIAPLADDGADGVDYGIRFYGPPLGYEFASLLEAVEAVARGQAELEPAAAAELAAVTRPVHLQIFTTPT